MAELHGLLDETVRRRDEIRTLQRHHDRSEQHHQREDRDDAALRPRVSTFWEYLRHANPAAPGVSYARAGRVVRAAPKQLTLSRFRRDKSLVKNFSSNCMSPPSRMTSDPKSDISSRVWIAFYVFSAAAGLSRSSPSPRPSSLHPGPSPRRRRGY